MVSNLIIYYLVIVLFNPIMSPKYIDLQAVLSIHQINIHTILNLTNVSKIIYNFPG